MGKKLVVAVTGASGMLTAKRLIEKSPFETALLASDWGRAVFERECGPFEQLAQSATEVFDNRDLSAPIASGSVETVGMVIVPCSANTLAQIAAGTGQNLISRAAHCHLKERCPLVLCLRESPLTLIDIENARAATLAGSVVMPLSLPFFMLEGQDPTSVSMVDLVDAYVDRVLKLFGITPARTWEHIR